MKYNSNEAKKSKKEKCEKHPKPRVFPVRYKTTVPIDHKNITAEIDLGNKQKSEKSKT